MRPEPPVALSAIDAGTAIGYTVRHAAHSQEQLRLPDAPPVGVSLRGQDRVALPYGDGPGGVLFLPRARRGGEVNFVKGRSVI